MEFGLSKAIPAELYIFKLIARLAVKNKCFLEENVTFHSSQSSCLLRSLLQHT